MRVRPDLDAQGISARADGRLDDSDDTAWEVPMSAELCIDCPRDARRPATGWHRCDEHRRVYWHRRRQESRDERRLIKTILANGSLTSGIPRV
jgi:hypothetical protein